MKASRVQRRAGTKTTVIPGATTTGQGALAKFKLGRYGRPSKMRLTKQNQHLWRK